MAEKSKTKNKGRKLTFQQKEFCHQMVILRNGTKAAIASGYSERCAAATASRLLRNVNVKNEVNRLTKLAAKRNDISVDRVLEEEKCLSFADIRTIFDSEGCLIPANELPEVIARAISGIEIQTRVEPGPAGDTITTYKYKMVDKGRSLERLGRYLSMYNDGLDVKFPDGAPVWRVEFINPGEVK